MRRIRHPDDDPPAAGRRNVTMVLATRDAAADVPWERKETACTKR